MLITGCLLWQTSLGASSSTDEGQDNRISALSPNKQFLIKDGRSVLDMFFTVTVTGPELLKQDYEFQHLSQEQQKQEKPLDDLDRDILNNLPKLACTLVTQTYDGYEQGPRSSLGLDILKPFKLSDDKQRFIPRSDAPENIMVQRPKMEEDALHIHTNEIPDLDTMKDSYKHDQGNLAHMTYEFIISNFHAAIDVYKKYRGKNLLETCDIKDPTEKKNTIQEIGAPAATPEAVKPTAVVEMPPKPATKPSEVTSPTGNRTATSEIPDLNAPTVTAPNPKSADFRVQEIN